jgi:hypothetical protein
MGAGVGIDVATMVMRRQSDRRERIVVAEDVIFGDRQLKVKDVQELAFNAANITLAEHARTERPVNVFESGIVKILARNHYGAKKDALTRPFLERDLKMRLGSIDVDERNEDGRDVDFSTGEHIVDEGGKCGMFRAARDSATAMG